MRANCKRVLTAGLWVLLIVLVVLLVRNIRTDSYLSGGELPGKKHRIAVIAKSETSTFWKSVKSGVGAACAAYNLDYLFEAPDSEEDYEGQNELIRQAVADGYESIVLSAVDYDGNAEAVSEAARAGVRIVTIDSDVNSNGVDFRIGSDNYQAGRMAGEALLRYEEGTIVLGIVGYYGNSRNGQERKRGFLDVVKGNNRVQIVDSIEVISATEEAQKSTAVMIKSHPDMNAIVTFNEWTTLGVGYTVNEMQMGDEIFVVGFDSNAVTVSMLETGEVDSLVVQNPYSMGYLGVETAYQLLVGQTSEEEKIDTSTMLVTRNNMYDENCQRLMFAFEE